MTAPEPGNHAAPQNWRLTFSGEIQPGKDLGEAKEALKKLFPGNVFAVLRPLAGGQPFIKDGLDAQTARRYCEAFAKAGAVCKIVETFRCPQCNIVVEKGRTCGVCATRKEMSQTQEPRKAPAPLIRVPERPVQGGYQGFGPIAGQEAAARDRAQTFLIRGGIVFALAFILDWYFSPRRGGTLYLYLFPWPYFFICIYYTLKSKGLPYWLLVLGFLHLAGLCLALFLPDQSEDGVWEGFKLARVARVALVVLLVGAGFLKLYAWHDLKHFGKLRTRLHEASIKIDPPRSSEELYLALDKCLDAGFDVLKSHRLRRDVSTQLSLDILETGAAFVHDARYRKIFLFKDASRVPDEYTEAGLMELAAKVLDDMYSRGLRSKSIPFLLTLFPWLELQINSSYENAPPYGDTINVIQEIQGALGSAATGIIKKTGDPPADMNTILSGMRPQLKEEIQKFAKMKMSPEGIITVQLNNNEKLVPMVRGHNILYALFQVESPTGTRPYTFQPGRTRLLRVGGDTTEAFRGVSSTFQRVASKARYTNDLRQWRSSGQIP